MAAGLAAGQVASAALPMVAPVLQTGFGIYQAIKGSKDKKAAEAELEVLRQKMGDTRYADFNQSYYDELQRRANVGLPTEQRLAMEQGANRAAGVNLATSEDRRAGLMGIGRAQTGLADAYTNIGLADVAQREQNAQAVLSEMSNRGTSTYNEQMNLLNYDVANQRSARQEALAMQQAGLQNTFTGLSSTATAGQGALNQFGVGQNLSQIY